MHLNRNVVAPVVVVHSSTKGILSAMNLGLLLEIPKVILKVGWIY